MLTVCVTFLIMTSAQAQNDNFNFNTIESLMMQQQECWNNGDIECFMKHYWNSEKLKFVGKKGVTYGWQNTYDNYKKAYPTKEKMGTLNFEIISHERLGEENVLTVGKWTLSYPDSDDLGGFFTLTWRKIDGEWKIIVDHTS